MRYSSTGTVMASASPSKKTARPGPLRPARSFHRTDSQEGSDTLNRPHRASTIQNGSTPEAGMPPRRAFTNPRVPEEPSTPDAFEVTSGDEEPEVTRGSVDMGELPIELVSLTDRYGPRFCSDYPRGHVPMGPRLMLLLPSPIASSIPSLPRFIQRPRISTTFRGCSRTSTASHQRI